MPTSHLYCTVCGAANDRQDTFCFNCGRPLKTSSGSMQYGTSGTASSTQTGLLTPNLLLRQRYRILRKLGRGGFGAVYKAEDTQFHNRLVAIKEMSQSGLQPEAVKEAVKAFEREAVMLTGLMHPNLPRIYDHFSDGGRWYLVMDFIEGETLEEHLNRAKGGYLSIEETLQIGIQLCTVLMYLHSRQPPIIFRDLKPANIMLTSDGHVYLIDFGIARLFKPGQTKDTIAFGSPGYAAPEQYGKAQTTPRSDIYSLGVILHQLLSGNDPTANSPTLFDFPVLTLPNQQTPSSLQMLVMQMIEKNASERPQSISEIQKKLRQILAEQTTGKISGSQTTSKTPLPPTQPVSRRPFPPTQPVGGPSAFPIKLPARSIRILAIIAAIIVLIAVLAFSISPLLNNLTQSSSQQTLKGPSATQVPISTIVPSPTSAQAVTPTPIPTTPTPSIKPGDTLYEADSSWAGWNGTKDWKVNGGLLLNDGTYAEYNANPTILAPTQLSTADYEVDLQMQVVSAFTTGTIYPCFYIAIRGTALSNGWQGYAAVVCDNLGHGPAVQIVAVDSSNNIFDVLTTTPFDPQNTSHNYRVEAKGTAIKLFVDGGLLLSADDSRYLNAGQVGLWSEYMQVKISSFKITAQ